MTNIYVSDRGNDQYDGRRRYTPIRSWKRVLELISGDDRLYILGMSAEPVVLRVKEEIYEKEKEEKKKKKKKKKKKNWLQRTFLPTKKN